MSNQQRFLEGVLAGGVEAGLIKPEDIFSQATPEILARHLPVKLKAKLLGACLNSSRVTASFLLDVVGLEALALYAPSYLLWNCIEACMLRSLGESVEEVPVSADGPVGKSTRGFYSGAANRGRDAKTVKRGKKEEVLPTRSPLEEGLDEDTLNGSLSIEQLKLQETHMGLGGKRVVIGSENDATSYDLADLGDDSNDIVTAVGADAAQREPQNPRTVPRK